MERAERWREQRGGESGRWREQRGGESGRWREQRGGESREVERAGGGESGRWREQRGGESREVERAERWREWEVERVGGGESREVERAGGGESGRWREVTSLPPDVSCCGLQLLLTARHGRHVGINEIHDVWFVVVREDTCKLSHRPGDGVLEHTVLGDLEIIVCMSVYVAWILGVNPSTSL